MTAKKTPTSRPTEQKRPTKHRAKPLDREVLLPPKAVAYLRDHVADAEEEAEAEDRGVAAVINAVVTGMRKSGVDFAALKDLKDLSAFVSDALSTHGRGEAPRLSPCSCGCTVVKLKCYNTESVDLDDEEDEEEERESRTSAKKDTQHITWQERASEGKGTDYGTDEFGAENESYVFARCSTCGAAGPNVAVGCLNAEATAAAERLAVLLWNRHLMPSAIRLRQHPEVRALIEAAQCAIGINTLQSMFAAMGDDVEDDDFKQYRDSLRLALQPFLPH